MRGRYVYAAVVAAALVAHFLVPEGFWDTVVQLGTCYLAALAIPLGLHGRGLTRAEQTPWWLFAGATALSSTGGIAVLSNVGELTGPDLSDYLYLSFYPMCAVALGIMIRQLNRRVSAAAAVEALIVTTGTGLLAWIYQIEPALHAGGEVFAERLTAIAYPIADMLLVALTVLMARTNGPEGGVAPRWIAGAFILYLIGDSAWVTVEHIHPEWSGDALTGRIIDGCYLLALSLLALAAWRPGVRAGETIGFRVSVPHFVLLSAAVMIAPAVLFAQTFDRQVTNGRAVAIGSTVMFALVIIRMGGLLRQSERTMRQVFELSRRDALTGLPNRRASTDELPRILDQARRDGLTLSVGMLDLDHFKDYNDRYGHPAGDRLLKEATAAWHAALRRSDVLARYGGEEFIVFLPGATLDEATHALDRLRPVTPHGQTFSAGIAAWDGTESPEDLIARADAALYTAKRSGRDQVCPAPAS
ncbi:diguanylate cyclase [Actinoplanes sp. N902-109]|nr:diguanylate cyclase [Actinoplanes sp. N902-109]